MTFTGKYNKEISKHEERKSNKSTTSNAKSEKSSGKLIISTQRMLRKKKERKTGYSRLSCLLTDPYTPNPTPPSYSPPSSVARRWIHTKVLEWKGLNIPVIATISKAQRWHFLNFITGRWGRGRE